MPQAARSSSDITGLMMHGVTVRRSGCGVSARAGVRGGGPGSTRGEIVEAARQLIRSCSVMTGFTSHGPVGRGPDGAGAGGGATRACGCVTAGGDGGATRAGAALDAARQFTRSCSVITGWTMQGPFGFSVSSGALCGGAALGAIAATAG